MSFAFGKVSLERLSTCDADSQKVAKLAITRSPIDFGIACGGRSPADQMIAFKTGKSKCDGVKNKSKHNYIPSQAFDVYAFVNGKASWDENHMCIIAGVIMACASELGINIRWGGTFGSDSFNGWDKPHYEKV